MQNCSLSNQRRSIEDGFGMTDEHIPISDRFLELNSHFSVPSHLEQCLDLKVIIGNKHITIYLFFCRSFEEDIYLDCFRA